MSVIKKFMQRRGLGARLPAVVFALLLAAATVGGETAGASDAITPESAGCLVVQHYYYPKEGMEDEVLATRIEGNEVRAALGLATSRLLILKSAASGHPASGEFGPGNASYLMSETVFSSEADAGEADKTLAASEDYLAVRGRMATLIDHFEMAVRTGAGGAC